MPPSTTYLGWIFGVWSVAMWPRHPLLVGEKEEEDRDGMATKEGSCYVGRRCDSAARVG